MVAETEVSKVSEVAAIDEKCEWRMSSYQDLLKPDCNGMRHNQTNDLDNTYVFVTRTDVITDGAVDNKDVVAGGSKISPESDTTFEGQNEKLDALSGEVSEPLNQGDNRNLEVTDENPLLVNSSTTEQESSLQDGDGFQVSLANSLEKHNGKTESLVEVTNNQPIPSDVKVEPGIPKSSTISSVEMTSDVALTCTTEILYCFGVKDDCAANIVLETEDVENMGDQLDGATGSSNKKLFAQENEDTGNCHVKDMSMASSEGSSADMIDGEEASTEAVRKLFNFLIRIPRFDDESLIEQIRLAKLHVDEKTKLRDSIQVQIQEKRANSRIHGVDYEYANGEYRSARKLVKSKRMEINSLLSVISKAKNALSTEDINNRICDMEHMIQHQTLPLKEEKQLIREIKQLKQLREQLSSNLGSEDEIKQALEQREEVEERLRILRKELHILKDCVLRAEATAMEAEKKYYDENKKVKELQALLRAADDVHQAAYAQWQSLRKELSEKNKHFFKYKDDAAAASNYAFSMDREALHRLCVNQVENFMELWNTNNEFRQEYLKFNARSTVQRFAALDGRSLSPNEESPILPSYVCERADMMVSNPAKVDCISQIPTLEQKQETTIKNVSSDDKLMKKMTECKDQIVTNNESAIDPLPENGFVMFTGRYVPDEVQEEVELTRKAEEIRREETEAKLKEQRRLEELAKANEARERKKRQAEKVQMRAELKAQKEAEQKEKEKEKRLRKKERRKGCVTDINYVNNDSETASNSERTVEISKDMSSMLHRKPQKPWLFTKQSNTKSVPPPLRHRSKKLYRQWMWVGLTSIGIFILFWLGNIGALPNINLNWQSRS